MVYTLKTEHKHSWWYWMFLVIGALFVLSVVVFTLEVTHVINLYTKPVNNSEQTRPVNSIDYSPATDDDKAVSEQIKNDESDNTTTQDIQLTLTRVTKDEATGDLIVRALIEGASTGTCKLELIKNGETVLIKTADIIQQNNFATCSGFNVSPSEFPTLGEVTVKVTANSNSTEVSQSQNIILEK